MEQEMQLMKLLSRCGHILHHRRCLNQSQNRVLMLLNHYGPMSQKHLMDHMHIQSGSMSELIAKVEHAGYIEKKRSQLDKRNFDLQLTEKGRDQAELFEQHQAILAERLFASLTPKQKDELQFVLEKLLEDWSDLKSCRQCERGEI